MAADESWPERKTYLHGDLDLIIIEAKNLPNMDVLSENIRRLVSAITSPFTKNCTTSHPPPPSQSPQEQQQQQDTPTNTTKSKSGRLIQHLPRKKIITSDPYVTVCVSGATVARTRVIPNNVNPEWNERFSIPLAHPTSTVDFVVKDDDFFDADYIGTASIPADRIASGEHIDQWLTIYSAKGKPAKEGAEIHLRMKFTPCQGNPRYSMDSDDGRSNTRMRRGVERSYFPMRHGGDVTLYQDAHVPESEARVEGAEMDDGSGKVEYVRGSCWEDICHAILEAQSMVYIIGWSIFHKVRLVREQTRRKLPVEREWILGDLLKFKSQEGVRVLLLVWDDKTSHSKFIIKTKGVMQTHDEETRRFFKHSSVICKLSPRYASSKLSIIKQQIVGTLYTHHQKCVIVDTLAKDGAKRKITAFLGGLDLCDGRYDTPQHRLFRDLDSTFKDDFHNPIIPAGSKGPREPWHDMHCKIEGPAAYDVLDNFEQRWRRTTKWSKLRGHLKHMRSFRDDALLKRERISWILSPSMELPADDPKLWVRDEKDPQNWHVQVFRSIDSGSVQGFPKDVEEAEKKKLDCTKNLVVDRSIQIAYIEAIRSAEHFIYIENQYFIGSSYAWPEYKRAGADNLIPMELALKITSKIRAKQPFAVYVVIPMWPEGDPSSASVQEILFWQSQTMQMMYQLIAEELKAMKMEGVHPQDYLNFYCLGNRDPPEEVSDPAQQQRASNSDSVTNSHKYRRFMIYVHSKGMIVDDEYVILGSANINQRSMAGQRDTEIAMGAYQPHYTWARQKGKHPQGQVYGYRLSLWAEHLGEIETGFKEAGSIDCVRRVNKIAEDNWNRYTDNKSFTPLKGHLLKYPVQVTVDGKVAALCELFPDFGGRVLGAPKSIPDALTT